MPSSQVEKNHTIKEYEKEFGVKFRNGELNSYTEGEIQEVDSLWNDDIVYWKIGDIYYETDIPYEQEYQYTSKMDKYRQFYKESKEKERLKENYIKNFTEFLDNDKNNYCYITFFIDKNDIVKDINCGCKNEEEFNNLCQYYINNENAEFFDVIMQGEQDNYRMEESLSLIEKKKKRRKKENKFKSFFGFPVYGPIIGIGKPCCKDSCKDCHCSPEASPESGDIGGDVGGAEGGSMSEGLNLLETQDRTKALIDALGLVGFRIDKDEDNKYWLVDDYDKTNSPIDLNDMTDKDKVKYIIDHISFYLDDTITDYIYQTYDVDIEEIDDFCKSYDYWYNKLDKSKHNKDLDNLSKFFNLLYSDKEVNFAKLIMED